MSDTLVAYARGAGGRIDRLPARYLDVIADAVASIHPKGVSYEMCELLISGRFRRSSHVQLRDLTLAQLRELRHIEARRAYARRKKMHGVNWLKSESVRVAARTRARRYELAQASRRPDTI